MRREQTVATEPPQETGAPALPAWVTFDPPEQPLDAIPFSTRIRRGYRAGEDLGEYIDSHMPGRCPNPEDVSLRLEAAGATNMLVEQLPDRERSVIRLRFGLDDGWPRTFEEVGDRLEIDREVVRALEIKAIKRLREIARGMASVQFLQPECSAR